MRFEIKVMLWIVLGFVLTMSVVFFLVDGINFVKILFFSLLILSMAMEMIRRFLKESKKEN